MDYSPITEADKPKKWERNAAISGISKHIRSKHFSVESSALCWRGGQNEWRCGNTQRPTAQSGTTGVL